MIAITRTGRTTGPQISASSVVPQSLNLMVHTRDDMGSSDAPVQMSEAGFAQGASSGGLFFRSGLLGRVFLLAGCLAAGWLLGCSTNGVQTGLVQPTPTPAPSPTPTPSPTGTAIAITEMSGAKPVTGGGGIVLLDGHPAGSINATGMLTIQVSPGAHALIVLDSGSRGDLTVNAIAGIATSASVTMIESDAVFAASSTQVQQITGGVFDFTAAASNPVIMRFQDTSSNPIAVSEITAAYVGTSAGTLVDLSNNVSLTTDHAVSIDLVSGLKTLGPDGPTIAANGPFLLEVDVTDANGVPYSGARTFELGIFSIAGKVSAPPSNALPLQARCSSRSENIAPR